MPVRTGVFLFRRGKGIFRFIFAADDLVRLFTMSLILFLGLNLLGADRTVILLGTASGLIIDLHDIFDDIKSGKPLDLGFN